MANNYEHENPRDFALKNLYDYMTTKGPPQQQRPPGKYEQPQPNTQPKQEQQTQVNTQADVNVPENAQLLSNNGKETIIHVNQMNIRRNKKAGEDYLPTYIVRPNSTTAIYTYRVDILGPSTLIDARENKQLNCGAKAWISTTSDIVIYGNMTFQESEQMRKQREESNEQ